MKSKYLQSLLVFLTLFSSLPALAEVSVSEAWARASAPGQKVGAAYMTLQSANESSLVYAETQRAGAVEMHFMRMHDGVMKMRQLETVTIPPQTPVKLAPGGTHLMLFDLKAPLKAGEAVVLKLCFEDKDGNITHQDVTFSVK